MKKIIILLSIIINFWINTTFWYEYIENISWNIVRVFKISAADDYKVIASVSKKGDSLETLVKSVWWVAWINWAYFCPKDYSICNWKNFSEWDRISNWVIYSKWNNTWSRYMFWFTNKNEPLIHKSPSIHPDDFEWIYNWISNFPLILKEWKSSLNEYEWLIDEKMKMKWIKNFICSTELGDIYMWHIYNQTMNSMVNILKNIGCYNALNLDSGWSLSLYNNWYKKWPWRNIMDAFVIVKKNKIDLKEKELTNKELINKSYSDNNEEYSSGIINNEIIEKDLSQHEENIFDKMSKKYNQFKNDIDNIKEKINNYIETIKSFFDKIRIYYDKVINFFN